MNENNKLGLPNDMIHKFEEQLVDFKIQIFNPNTTFNTSSFDLEYLKRLHGFLFGDLYEEAGQISPRIPKEEYAKINDSIKKIEDMIQYIDYVDDISVIKDDIEDIIDLQMFPDGNNRTIKLFFKTMTECFSYPDNPKYKQLLTLLETKSRGLK